MYVINVFNVVIILVLWLFFVENYDWEGIVVGFCGKSSCIYIGDS